MVLQQIIINDKKEDKVLFSSKDFNSSKANLVLAFGERVFLDAILPYKKIKEIYPAAHIVICSTSRQISNTNLIENNIVATAISFEKTIVGLNSDASLGKIVAVAFYGNAVHFGFGSKGGWSDFGPEREVTFSENNILYKIGDRFALDLYKEYLGKYAEELPGSSLYFPLSMKENKNAEPIVRTILSIDEEIKSMTFAGNIPQGSFVRLMKGNLDKIIDASYNAAL